MARSYVDKIQEIDDHIDLLRQLMDIRDYCAVADI